MKIARVPMKKARIEIIPLIDTVFFLLVFFMMASLAMTVHRGMPVNLPQAASGARTANDSASVTIDREGRTFLDEQPVSLDALRAKVVGLRNANPALAVVVNADGDVSHRHVVSVLDVVREVGVSRLAIAVTPTPGSVAK